MFGRRKKRDEDKLELSGGIKWLHKLLRVVLYPFIHPVWFVIIAVVISVALIAWPAYYGIEVAAVPRWYKQKFNHYYSLFTTETVKALPKTENMLANSGLTGQGINVKAIERKPGKAELVTYETPQMVNRRVFQQAQEVPVDVAATLGKMRNEENIPVFKRNNALGLTYLERPKKITGVVQVVNANELKIDNEVFFLYGIYAVPASNEGIAAMRYLQQNVDGHQADCFIGAYAADGTATAICIYDGINVNQRLVDLKYSKDVSLN